MKTENLHMSDRNCDAVRKLDTRRRNAYLKHGNEIISGLEKLNIQSMTAEESFIFYYFACEWMAKIFYGLSVNKSITELKKLGSFDVEWIRRARQDLDLNITTEELNALFYTKHKKPARHLRNKTAHNFAESTLQEIAEHETEFIPIFKKLLKEWETVSARLE